METRLSSTNQFRFFITSPFRKLRFHRNILTIGCRNLTKNLDHFPQELGFGRSFNYSGDMFNRPNKPTKQLYNVNPNKHVCNHHHYGYNRHYKFLSEKLAFTTPFYRLSRPRQTPNASLLVNILNLPRRATSKESKGRSPSINRIGFMAVNPTWFMAASPTLSRCRSLF